MRPGPAGGRPKQEAIIPMLSAEISGVLYGLAAAAVWGAGDFSGGVAAKRTSAYGVVIFSQSVGLAILAAAIGIAGEPLPPPGDFLWGACAGLSSSVGLVMLYRALARGNMGVVAPVTAVATVCTPLLFAALRDGPPPGLKMAGFALALVSIVLVTRSGRGKAVGLAELKLPVLAGLCFGVFFILMDHVANRAVLWPVVAVRIASIALLAAVATFAGQRKSPALDQVPLVALVGVFETGGTLLFVLATRSGRLDIAAVLACLYPAITALMARTFLKERLRRVQWLGVGVALAAVALISA
jgi:drug/metabolite transporter (DMT)-like permease